MRPVRLNAATLGTFVNHLSWFQLEALYVFLSSVPFWHCPLTKSQNKNKTWIILEELQLEYSAWICMWGWQGASIPGQCTWPGGVRQERGMPGCWKGSRSRCCMSDSWRGVASQIAPQTLHRTPAARWWRHTWFHKRPLWTTWRRQRRTWLHLWRWGCAAQPASSWSLPLCAHGCAPHPCICAPDSSSFI